MDFFLDNLSSFLNEKRDIFIGIGFGPWLQRDEAPVEGPAWSPAVYLDFLWFF